MKKHGVYRLFFQEYIDCFFSNIIHRCFLSNCLKLMWNCSQTITGDSHVIHSSSDALKLFFISDMLCCNINDRLTPSVQKVLELIPAHSYMHQNSLGCNLCQLNSSTSKTRNLTSFDVGTFHNMLFRRRDLPLCSWDKWVDQLSLLLL